MPSLRSVAGPQTVAIGALALSYVASVGGDCLIRAGGYCVELY